MFLIVVVPCIAICGISPLFLLLLEIATFLRSLDRPTPCPLCPTVSGARSPDRPCVLHGLCAAAASVPQWPVPEDCARPVPDQVAHRWRAEGSGLGGGADRARRREALQGKRRALLGWLHQLWCLVVMLLLALEILLPAMPNPESPEAVALGVCAEGTTS